MGNKDLPVKTHRASEILCMCIIKYIFVTAHEYVKKKPGDSHLIDIESSKTMQIKMSIRICIIIYNVCDYAL
jgi:hypothetical protein